MTKAVTAALAALLILPASAAQAGGFWKPFLAGAVSGFAIHEGSHLALDIAFDADPRLKGKVTLPLIAALRQATPADRRKLHALASRKKWTPG